MMKYSRGLGFGIKGLQPWNLQWELNKNTFQIYDSNSSKIYQ